MSGTFADESKISWASKKDPTSDQLKLGCLQRIADATELMAKNYAELINERDRYFKWHKAAMEDVDILYRRISALKGVITKLKNQRKETK